MKQTLWWGESEGMAVGGWRSGGPRKWLDVNEVCSPESLRSIVPSDLDTGKSRAHEFQSTLVLTSLSLLKQS